MALTVKINGDTSSLDSTLNKLKGRMSGLKLPDLIGSSFLGNLGSNIVSTITGAIMEAGKVPLKLGVEFITGSIRAAADFEKLQVQLGVVTNNAKDAKKMLDKFREIDARSPLNLSDLLQEANVLLFKNVQSVDEVIASVEQLANISLGDPQKFQSLALAFGQVMDIGRLKAQELNQFVNAGFNPLAAIAQKTGLSMDVLRQKMEDGKIPASGIVNIIKEMASGTGIFAKAAQEAGTTFDAKLSGMQNSWKQLRISFGTPFLDPLKKAFDAINKTIPTLTPELTRLATVIASIIPDLVRAFQTYAPILPTLISKMVDNIVSGEVINAGVKVGLAIGNIIGQGIMSGIFTVIQNLPEVLKNKIGVLGEKFLADPFGMMQSIDPLTQLNIMPSFEDILGMNATALGLVGKGPGNTQEERDRIFGMMQKALPNLSRTGGAGGIFTPEETAKRIAEREQNFSLATNKLFTDTINNSAKSLSDALSKELRAGLGVDHSQLQAQQFAREFEYALKHGIDQNMSRAVREGVLEAWAKKTPQSTFSN